MRASIRLSAALAVFVGFASLLSTFPASAGILNIGNGANGTNPTGLLPPQDPVLLGNGNDISISLNGNNANTTNQLLLTILIPNDTTNLFAQDPLGIVTVFPNFPSTTGQHSGSSAFTGTGFGLGSGTAIYQGNGFWGAFQATGSAKLSDFLDSSFSSSLSASNFVAFDSSVGITSTQFGVYTFAITTGALHADQGNNPLADIQIPGGLPLGSIAVALDDNLDTTVWTNSGGVNIPGPNVPEPTSLVLFGTALAGLGLLGHRRRNIV